MIWFTVVKRPAATQIDDWDFVTAFKEQQEAENYIEENRTKDNMLLMIQEKLDDNDTSVRQ